MGSQDTFFITSNAESQQCLHAHGLQSQLLVLMLLFITHIFRGEHGNGNILESCGISEESTVYFSLSSFAEEVQDHKLFFTDDVLPCVQQTTKGISTFLSSLYILVGRIIEPSFSYFAACNNFQTQEPENVLHTLFIVESCLSWKNTVILWFILSTNTKITSRQKWIMFGFLFIIQKELTLTLSEAPLTVSNMLITIF